MEIRSLTGLRFVAALYVFAFHIHIRTPIIDAGPLFRFLNNGAVGMSIFFMLSGYILAHRYRGLPPEDLGVYFRARFARIYPIYALAALVTLPWIGDLSPFSAVGLLTANIFAVQAWFPWMFWEWNNGASWSISAEAFFYLLFPFIIERLRSRTLIELALLAVLMWLAASVLALLPRVGTPLPIYYSVPIFRLPEFVSGILAYFIARTAEGLTIKKIAWPLLAVTMGYLSIAPSDIYVTHNWIVVPALFALLMKLGDGRPAGFLSSAPAEWLGKISYCFYSFQLLILYIVLPAMKGYPGWIVLMVAFIPLTALSAAGYYWVEEPMRKWLTRAKTSDKKQGLVAERPAI